MNSEHSGDEAGSSGMCAARLPRVCEDGIEQAIRYFREALPGWWYSLGECEVSCDASCAPTRESPDLALIPHDARFDQGFHVDVAQPSKLAEALLEVMAQAIEARDALPAVAHEPASGLLSPLSPPPLRSIENE